MVDPYREFRVGDPMPRDAATFNAFSQGARLARDSQFDVESGGQPRPLQGDIVRVKNESGQDIERLGILGLDGPIFEPSTAEDAFLNEVVFRGIVPADVHRGKFAVMREPLLNGRIGKGYVSGVCQVRIDMVDSGDTHADVYNTDPYALVSSGHGSAQILYVESAVSYGGYDSYYGADTRYAIVRLGAQERATALACVTTTITAASGRTFGTGVITLQKISGSALANDTNYTGLVCRNFTNKIVASGTNNIISVFRELGTWWFDGPGNCTYLS